MFPRGLGSSSNILICVFPSCGVDGVELIGCLAAAQTRFSLPESEIAAILAESAIMYRIARNNARSESERKAVKKITPKQFQAWGVISKVLAGRSKIRNHALAEAFNYMDVIEQWGSGLCRVSEELAAYGVKPLQLEDGGINVRVNVFRNDAKAGTKDKSEGNCEGN